VFASHRCLQNESVNCIKKRAQIIVCTHLSLELFGGWAGTSLLQQNGRQNKTRKRNTPNRQVSGHFHGTNYCSLPFSIMSFAPVWFPRARASVSAFHPAHI
jgi:hypothetical protein